MNQDEEHLKLLSIFHYVVAGIAALFACFPIFHFIIGVSMLIGSLVAPSEEALPFTFVGLIFTVFAGGIIFLGWSFAAAMVVAGRFLATKKYYTFCLVIGGIDCLFMPFGTVLGVFTIIVLVRPSVKALFEANQPAQLPA